MKTLLCLVTVLCALGAGIGFFYGYRTARTTSIDSDGRNPEQQVKGPARVSLLVSDGERTAKEQRIGASELVALLTRAIPAQDVEKLAEARRAVADFSLTDVRAALAQIEGIEDSFLRGQVFQVVIERWAQLDPKAALDYTLESTFAFNIREACFERIFRNWAKTDPAGAFAAWKRAGDAVENLYEIQHGVLSIFGAWREVDFDAAFEAFRQIEHSGNRYTAMNGLAEGAGDPAYRERLIEKILTLESAADRKRAWESLARSWVHSGSPQEVAAWIDRSENLAADEVDAIERSVARERMSAVREDGIAWLLARADEESLSGHLETIVSDWVNSEPNACGLWLRERGLGPETDRAVAAYAEAVVRDDGESAFAWASSIHDDALRSQTLGRVASLWFRMDPAAAEAAIEAAPFPDEEKRALYEKRKR